MNRTETRQVKVGNLEIGHNNRVIIQSMCNIETKNGSLTPLFTTDLKHSA